MTEYVTTERITVPGGTVMRLSPQQALDRQHQLRVLEADVYEATSPLEFKSGEALGILGDLGRATMARLVPAPAAAPAEGVASTPPAADGSTAAPASERGAAVRARGRKAPSAESE